MAIGLDSLLKDGSLPIASRPATNGSSTILNKPWRTSSEGSVRSRRTTPCWLALPMERIERE